jgi:transcriptional regulator with XRE-family HTH domain
MQAHPLKIYRETQTPKLSQADLAQMLGVARLTILRWESGERKIGPSLIPMVTERTGIPAGDLRPDLGELFGEAAQ